VDVESIRAYCLSLPQATEDIKPQWGDALLFRIAGKIFVSMSLSDIPLHMNAKCTPARFAELLEVAGVKVAAYVGRYHWIDFPIAGVFRDAEVKELISESYENVRSKLPKSALGSKQTPARKPKKLKMKKSE